MSAEQMGAGQVEVINFPDMQVPIQRGRAPEIFLALEPPHALPYVVAHQEIPIEDIVSFVQQRLDGLRDLRTEMLKHYKKTKSTKCRFRTGDVAYLLGRPFMLRSNPLSSTSRNKKPTRSIASLQASIHSEFSVINLYVVQTNNYEQGKAAFMGQAQKIFSTNIKSLLAQCMQRVFPKETALSNVNSRPMRSSWVQIDEEHDAVWFSENLIPYPAHAVVYAFVIEAIKHYAPDASEEERLEFLERGVPNWQEMKALLADSNNRYSL